MRIARRHQREEDRGTSTTRRLGTRKRSAIVAILAVLALGLAAFTSITPLYTFIGSPQHLTGFASTPGGSGPAGIAFLNGVIYVADANDNNLYQFNPAGGAYTSRTPIGGGCSGAIGLAVDAGELYVACSYTPAIYKVTITGATTGATVTLVTSAVTRPRDIAVDANGDLLVTTAFDGIKRVTTAGAVTSCAAASAIINGPDGLVIDKTQGNNKIYVSNMASNTIAVMTLSAGVCGAPSTFTTFGGGPGLDGIAIGLAGTDCQDTLFVNANNGKLYGVTVSNPTNHYVIADSPLGTQRGDVVKVSPDNYLYATQSDHVSKIGPDCFMAGDDNPPTPCGDSEIDGYTDCPSTLHTGPASSDTYFDNCPSLSNPTQLNTDGNFFDTSPPYVVAVDDKTWPNSDALGDECDSDDDNDGISDADEASGAACGGTATLPLSFDTDGDRARDGAECSIGTDPTSAASFPALAACGAAGDADGDKIATRTEFCYYGSSTTSTDSDGDLVGGLDGDGGKDGCEVASLNGDQIVSSGDQGKLASGISGSVPYHAGTDLNKDGLLNSGDQGLMASFITPPGQCP